jgi:hypothetical protein
MDGIRRAGRELSNRGRWGAADRRGRQSLDGFYPADGLLDWLQTNSGGFAVPGPQQVGV